MDSALCEIPWGKGRHPSEMGKAVFFRSRDMLRDLNEVPSVIPMPLAERVVSPSDYLFRKKENMLLQAAA